MSASYHTTPTAPGAGGTYLPTLDGWRAISIGFVLLAHGYDSLLPLFDLLGLGIPDFGETVRSSGQFGVRMFFAISGFLITARLLEEEQKRGRISLSAFYVRRAFRILPPATAYLLTVALLAGCGAIAVSPGNWLSALLFFKNYWTGEQSWYVGHFWSLSVEEHYYLLWPGIFLLLTSHRKRVLSLVGAALLVALWRAIDFKFRLTWADAGPAYFWGRTDIVADGLLWGAAYALMYSNRKIRACFHSSLCRLLFWLTLAFVLITFYTPLPWKLDFLLLTTRALLLPALLLWTIENPSSRFSAILEQRHIVWVGRLSYSIYLWQQLFLTYVEASVPKLSWVQLFPVNLVLVLLVAWSSYNYIERPCILLGRRLLRPRK
jgi:peptidoglycan/LPS O-acetylase OafA/YrhL